MGQRSEQDIRHNLLTPFEATPNQIEDVANKIRSLLRENVQRDSKNSSYADALVVLNSADNLALAQAYKGDNHTTVRIDVFENGIPNATIARALKENRVMFVDGLLYPEPPGIKKEKKAGKL